MNKGFHKIGCGQQGVDIAALLYNNLLEVSILNTFDTQNYLLLTLQFRFYMKPFHHLCNKTRFTGMADLSLLFYQLGTIIVLLLNSISIRLGYTGLYYCWSHSYSIPSWWRYHFSTIYAFKLLQETPNLLIGFTDLKQKQTLFHVKKIAMYDNITYITFTLHISSV